MNLRMIGLATVVVCTALLPLAASAGQAGSGSETGSGLDPVLDPLLGSGTSDAEPGRPAEPAGSTAASAAPRAPSRPPFGPTSRCGPELTSPDGIEAQTCVLSEGRDTWARTYYRNTTGAELDSVLTLMAPAGRTVRVHCEVTAADEPGACETPREATAGGAGAYTAVAEFADATGEGPLLLRSGSNSAAPSER
ncbi:hypothetical protein [Streptomyces sp. NPDC050504]|uniref:hypothetical protein n=1 Tax=Streptomyces sp. NPDC050504 TaxID=3365618 RepID=UPI0037878C2A